METWLKGEKTFASLRFPGGGVFEMGFDGTTGWSRDPIEGLKTLTREEMSKSGFFDDAPGSWIDITSFRSEYIRARVSVGKTINGRNTYVLDAYRNDGSSKMMNFDSLTGALLREAYFNATNKLEEVSFFSDYRKIGNRQIPFVIQGERDGESFEVRLAAIEFGIATPESLFRMPAR